MLAQLKHKHIAACVFVLATTIFPAYMVAQVHSVTSVAGELARGPLPDNAWRTIFGPNVLVEDARHAMMILTSPAHGTEKFSVGLVDHIAMDATMEQGHRHLAETLVELTQENTGVEEILDNPHLYHQIREANGLSIADILRAAIPSASDEIAPIINLVLDGGSDWRIAGNVLRHFSDANGTFVRDQRYPMRGTQRALSTTESITEANISLVSGTFENGQGESRIVVGQVHHLRWEDGRETYNFYPTNVCSSLEAANQLATWLSTVDGQFYYGLNTYGLNSCARDCLDEANEDRAVQSASLNIAVSACTAGLVGGMVGCGFKCLKYSFWGGWGAVVCLGICLAVVLIGHHICVSAASRYYHARLDQIRGVLKRCLRQCRIDPDSILPRPRM